MSCRVISVINMKGGVGKTTLTVNLAYTLFKEHEKNVLVIDIDPQFNSTQYLMGQKKYVDYLKSDSNKTIYSIFKDSTLEGPSTVRDRNIKNKVQKVTLENVTVRIKDNKNHLDLIPSTLQLMELGTSKRGTENRLKRFVSKIKKAYDIILIDCPPTLSIFTLSAYLASDAYIVPIKPDHLSSIGLPLLERAIAEYEEDHDKRLEFLGIIFTMVDLRTNLMKTTMEQIRESYGEYVFDNVMRRSIAIAEAVRSNSPIIDYSKAIDYGHDEDIKGITEEFLDRLEGKYDEK